MCILESSFQYPLNEYRRETTVVILLLSSLLLPIHIYYDYYEIRNSLILERKHQHCYKRELIPRRSLMNSITHARSQGNQFKL